MGVDVKIMKTIADISNLKESSELECKLAQGRDGKGAIPKDMWESYSAFANSSGGNIIHLHVPRASRKEQPLYIKGNPLTGSYQRYNSADILMSEESVHRMMAEQLEDNRDKKIVRGFTIDELNTESIKAFRNIFFSHKSDHPWNELSNNHFLKQIGCWRRDHETGEEGLTAAGLLMFGTSSLIEEVFPSYFLDYQELPDDSTEIRWLDRLVPDGTWSGNIFDFYRRVIRKLEEGLKIPFSIQNNIRQDDSLTHQAVREAFINCLVHADYSDRASIKVTKSSKGFYFRNPGTMRVPAKIALEGGVSDCRNQTLHKLFLLLGLGERAGSGLPKIKQGWTDKGHSLKLYDTNMPFNQTIIELNWFVPEGAQLEPHKIQVTGQVTGQVTSEILDLIICCDGELSRKELMEKMQLKSRENFEKRYLKPALSLELIEWTIPGKPNSRLQKYRLTDKGVKFFEISKTKRLEQ